MFKYIKIYSIDIALGAVVSCWFLGEIGKAPLDWYIFVVIGLIVWSIYTIDHLIDGYKMKDNMGPSRYFYHQKFLIPVSLFLIFILLCAGALVYFFFPEGLIEIGLILSVVVLLYFILRLLLARLFAGIKELFAAVVYTAGVALPAFFFMEQQLYFFLTVVLQFFCIVFANLLICSIWDEKIDRQYSHDSMTVAYGIRFINFIIFALICMSLIASVAGLFLYKAYFLRVEVIILLMNIGLIIVFNFGRKLDDHVQRFLIDSIFFIPLVMLL